MFSTKNEQLLILLSRVTTQLHRQLDTVWAEYGLTRTQFAVMEVLYQKGDLPIKAIQEAVLGTAGNIPVVINNLVKYGYVTRHTSSQDKRMSFIHLTEHGVKLVEQILPIQRQKLNQLLNHVTTEQKQQLLRLLVQTHRGL